MGIEKTGTDRLKVAADAFRKLGEDDQNDPDFDLEFAECVRKQVEQLEEEEMIEEEEKVAEGELEQRGKLGREISQKEVNKAIDKLKNGKAAGQDAIIAEVLKWAGESKRHILCGRCVVSRGALKKCLMNGCKDLCSLCIRMEMTEIDSTIEVSPCLAL